MAYQGLNRDETEGDVRMEYSNPNEQLPLPGRLGEYERILRFSTERLHSKHARVLFVFGACGCGKTSSILRALRSFSARPLSSDNRKLVVSAAPSAVKRARSSNSATLSGVKRRRSEADDVSGTTSAEDSPGRRSGSSASSAAAASSSPSSGRSSASPIDAAESELQRGFSELSERYDVLYTTRSGRRPIQGHYINCADLTSQQLIDAVHHSIHAAFPRSADANTKALLTSLEALAEATKKSRGRVKTSSMPKEPSITAGDAAAVCGRGARTMHLVALDEVEYARPAAKAILSELASLSFRYPTQLALIYISNVRHLVHVPQMLLEELAFEAYDVPTLRLIAQRIASVEIAACEQRCTLVSQPVQAITRGAKKKKPVTADATRVKLSAGLLEYIARKALLEFSGDVRQVAAMTRRAIFRAFAEWASSYSVDECERSMRAAVDEAGEDMDKQRSSTGSSSSEGAGASTPKAAVAAASTRSTSINVTLAGASKGLSGHQVEMHVQQHISSMPEQMLFVLCCLMVLTWRIGMGVGSNNQYSLATVASSTTTTSTTLSVRRVHALYTALMGLHHFPSMSRAGILSAIDGLADLGILTRPQRRGSEEVFTLNGVWSLVAMEAALKARGEALRQEREACGLDGSENKFSAVLSDLRQIAQLPCLA